MNSSASPALEDPVHGRLVDLEQIGDRLLVRRQPDDRADIEIAIRPAVAPAADAWGKRVVDGRMTDGARDPDGRETPAPIEEAPEADDGVQLQ